MQALIGASLHYAGLSRQSSTTGQAIEATADAGDSQALVRAGSVEDEERHKALAKAAQQLVVADQTRPLLLPENLAMLITAASLAARVSMHVHNCPELAD